MEDIPINGSGPRGGTVDRLVQGLREGILTSHYAPGQRLVEADLTRRFGVSRGPLREAFRRLTAEGLLQIVPNCGALVRRLTYEETVELHQIRAALEPLAARLAAQAIDKDGNRRRFESAISRIWSTARRLHSAYHQENRQFHLSIFEFCGNHQLTEMSRQLQLPLIMLQLGDTKTPRTFRESVVEHREIASAILDSDADAAEEAMRRHLVRASRIVEAVPRTVFSKSPANGRGSAVR